MGSLLSRGKAWIGGGTAIRFSTSVMVLQGFTIAANLIILRWLPPDRLGLWQSLLLIGVYAGILEGGVVSGLDRELPFTVGKGDSETAAGLAATAQAVTIMAVVICILSIPVAFFYLDDLDGRIGVFAILTATAVRMYRRYLGTTFKAAQRFDSLARIQFFEAILVIVTLPLVAWWGFRGLAVRYVVLALAVGLVMFLARPMPGVRGRSLRRLRELMVVGIPLYISTYLNGVSRTLPRLVMLATGGVLWVGFFAPASALVRGLSMVPSSLAIYFYPRMSHRLGETGDPATLWPTVVRVVLANFVVAVPAVMGVYLVIPSVIRRFFPAYERSIPLILLVALAGFFLSAGIAGNALHSLKAWKWIAMVAVMRLVFFGVFPWMGYLVFHSLEGIAAGVTAAFAADFMVTLYSARKATRAPAVVDVT